MCCFVYAKSRIAMGALSETLQDVSNRMVYCCQRCLLRIVLQSLHAHTLQTSCLSAFLVCMAAAQVLLYQTSSQVDATALTERRMSSRDMGSLES